MAAYVHVGSFQSPTSTGSQVVTGLGFTPKALMIWGQNAALTPPEFADYTYWSFGWSDGTTHLATTSLAFDAQATMDVNRAAITTAIITAHDSNNLTQHRATLTSFDSGGFTLNWSNIFGSEPRHYIFLAVGGSDVSAKVAIVNANTGTGAQAITGVGFQPSVLFGLPLFPTGETVDACNLPALGWGDGTRQGCGYVVSLDNVANADTFHYQRTDKFLAWGNIATAAVVAEASLTSLDSDGFTINITTAAGGPQRIAYLAISGLSAYVGSLTQPTSTGLQTVSAPGFRPGAVLFQSVGDTAHSTVQAENRWSFGGAACTTNRASAQHDTDAAANDISARYYSETLAIASMTAAATGTSSTLNAGAKVDSFEGNGFVLNWTTVDATAREVLYLALSGEVPSCELSRCEGGGAITILADEADGETFTGRTVSPRAWLTVAYDDADRSFGLDAMNHPTRRIQGHLMRLGIISRQLSDQFSSYKMAGFSADVDNASRFMDTLETTAASEHWANREFRVHLASPTTIAAAGTVHTLMRGILRSNRSRGLQRTIGGTDILGSEFSRFNLEGPVQSRLIGDDFSGYTNIPNESLTRVVPIGYGHLSDQSATSTEIGSSLTFDSTIAVPYARGTIATDGLGTFAGGVCARIAAVFGSTEGPLTPPGGLYVADGNSLYVHWTQVAGADSYRIYLSDNGDFDPYSNPVATFARLLTHDNVTIDGITAEWDFSLLMHGPTDGVDALDDAATSASVDTGHGMVSPVYVGTESVGGTLYHAWVLCGHAIQDVHDLYIDGVAQYIETNTAMAGVGGTWLVPGFAGYTAAFGATTYRTIGGHRYTMILGKAGVYGPDRAAGVVQPETAPNSALTSGAVYAPFAVNLCGIEDVGDGTGNTLTNAARIAYHLLQQWVLQRYTTGSWASEALSDDGVPWLNSQSFSDCEDIEVGRVGGEGYQAAIYLDQPLTLRELLSKLLQNFDLRFGQNEHGQVFATHLNDQVDLSTVPTVSDVAEIFEPTEMDPRLEELENRVVYDYGYRFSDQVFTTEGATIEDALAIAANLDRAAVGDRRSLDWVADQATADDVAGWALAFGKYPPRYVEMTGPLHWLRIKLGDIITATDVDGLGVTGWDDRALWVLGIQVEINDLETAPCVRLSCVDVQRLLDGFALLGNASTLNSWTAESEANRSRYLFLANKTTGLFSDGAPAKRLR